MTRQIIRQPILLYLTAGLLAIAPAARADSLVYDFEEEGTGNVLAQLELSSLPATHEEVVRLTFTPAGQEIFGWSFAEYPGTFTTTCLSFIDDDMGGLTGEDFCFTEPAYIHSRDPPQSSLLPLTPRSFFMYADFIYDVDMLQLWAFDDGITATGDWRIVPEPTGHFLVCWSALVVACLSSRGRKT